MAVEGSPNVNSVIEQISEQIPLESTLYYTICSLLAVLKPRYIPSTIFNQGLTISQLYYKLMENWLDGLAKFYFVLKMCDCPDQLLQSLKTFVPKTFETKDKKVWFQIMIIRIVSQLDAEKARRLVDVARTEMNPPVNPDNLAKPIDGDYTPRLLNFFTEAEQRVLLSPDNLDNLRRWLLDLGCLKIVDEYIKKFEEEKFEEETTSFTARGDYKDEKQDSVEEDQTTEKSELVNSVD